MSSTSESTLPVVHHWIDGAILLGASSWLAPVYDPAIEEKSATVALANKQDFDAAVASTKATYRAWRDSSMARWQQIIFAFRELLNARKAELADNVTSEHSKVTSDALGEVTRDKEAVDGLLEHDDGTSDAGAARWFQNEVEVDMIGINVPISVPVAYHAFGGWKNLLLADSKAYGRHGFEFFTREKAITSRWLDPSHGGINLVFPETK